MVQWNTPIEWRFNLRQLFLAMTANAAACGVLVSTAPAEVKGLAICVLVFSTGVAILIGGAARLRPKSIAAHMLGLVVMSLGFGIVSISIIGAVTIFLHLAAYFALRFAA